MGSAVRLGLTGGIGSGKSTVARMLAKRGAAVIDADAISRSVTASGGAAIAAIAAEFGAEFINTAGALDRERMRNLVFADTSARLRLERIVHPLIGREIEHQSTAAISAGRSVLVFDVPLLVESGHWRQKLDRVLVVDCPPDVQVARVMARDGLALEAVEKIIASQAARVERLRAADLVLFNDGLDLAQLAHKVEQIAARFGLSSQ
jgi:dephospho-CoA kinase